MTSAEALALIRSSTVYRNANGDLRLTVERYVRNNRGEAIRIAEYLLAYAKGQPAVLPDPATAFGDGVAGFLPVAPPPPVPAARVKGAFAVTAANSGPTLMRAAGVTHLSVELTGPNLTEIAQSAYDGFVKGGLFISRGPDAEREATHVATILNDNPSLRFVVIDTECHKVGNGGQREWTENLYRELRARKPFPYWVANITFGVDAAVDDVVNHAALRKYGIAAIWEAYDGAGVTQGVDVISKTARTGGWEPPHIALGDKSLVQDVAKLRELGQSVGDVWLWAVDNGPAQDALRSGVVIP
jgi:hypothetical protein